MPKFELNQQTFQKDHGTITLYQRPDSKKPTFYCRIAIDGTTGYVRKSTGKTDLMQAYGVAEALYLSLVAKPQTGKVKSVPTFGSVAREWLAMLKEQGKTTVQDFTDRLNRYGYPFFGSDTPIDQFNEQTAIDFVNHRLKSVSPNTVRRDCVPLVQLFTFAYSKRYTDRPIKFKHNLDRNRRPAFTQTEVRDIRRALDTRLGIKHRAIHRARFYLKHWVMVVLKLGLRPGTETQNINWKCLDYHTIEGKEHPQLVLLVPKSKSPARWIIAENASQNFGLVKRYRQEECQRLKIDFNESEAIFANAKGRPIGSFKKSFNALLEDLDLLVGREGVERTPYSLRHTCATRLLGSGLPPALVARHLGTSLEMLHEHYFDYDLEQHGKMILDAKLPSVSKELTQFFDED